MAGAATLAYVNCDRDKRICKAFKASPASVELKHFHNGKFNVDYERSLSVKSIVNFLADPTGDLPWEEESDGQHVLHIGDEKAFHKLVKKAKLPMLVILFSLCLCEVANYRNALRDDAALLKGIPLSNAALCHVEAYPPFSPLTS